MRQTRKREKERIGTSQRAWGRHRCFWKSKLNARNIPTLVGNTNSQVNINKTPSGHPHERGEDLDDYLCGVELTGTSPRAWGRQSQRWVRRVFRRNIPTSVGKTLKMLSKINHLTFSKVPFSLTFKSCPKSSVFLFSLIRLSKSFVPFNLCRLERHPYTT